jgi:hypothetical protein
MDPEFAEDVQRAAAIAGSSRLSAYLRIPGDGLPRLCSGRRRKPGKVAVHQGDALAIN